MHTSSADGDHETLGRTDDAPADLDEDEEATVVSLLKKILLLLETALSDK